MSTSTSTSTLQRCWSLMPTSDLQTAPASRAAEQHGSPLGAGWAQAEPCSRPHSGARTLLNPQDASQDSALLQSGLWL